MNTRIRLEPLPAIRIAPEALGRALAGFAARVQALPRRPLMLVLVVFAAALLSAFVLVVQAASAHGDELREHQRLTGRYDARATAAPKGATPAPVVTLR